MADANKESLLVKISEKLNEQAWFQQLKQKWEELDPQSRMYLKYVGGGLSVLLSVTLVIVAWVNVRSLRQEMAEKSELLNTLQSANEELRRLKEATGTSAPAGGEPAAQQPWQPFIESTAGNAGIDRGSLTVQPEKTGASSDVAKEAIIEINVKKVDVKKLTRFAYFLENSNRPVKLRNLTIESKDANGNLDATLAISGFTLKP